MTRREKGFTLVELLVVVAIIGVLATIGVTVFTGARSSANNAKAKADIDSIRKAYEGKYDPISGNYAPLTDSDFSGGKIPTPDAGGSYFVLGPNFAPSPTTANFALCASLRSGVTCPSPNSVDCDCNTSTQGTPVDPSVIAGISNSGLALWLKADTGVYSDAGTTLANNNEPVQQWKDQSGLERNATQNTLGIRPIYKTNILNGKPVLEFSGTQWMLVNAILLNNVPGYTTFVVYNAPGALTGAFFATRGSGNAPFGHYLQFGIFNRWADGLGANGTGPLNENSTYRIQVFKNDFNSAYNYENGITNGPSSTTHASGQTYTSGLWGVGSEGAGNQIVASLNFAEGIVYDRALSDTDRKNVERYLGSKYGITISN